uniref:Aminoacyl-transfer RNA synthetases class-II family profile domain-containing protein n=1 Tax=Ditylum brightwellii TaxID=49249 RepID=A0A6V2B1A7_9STRA|mmetsp:Transcript_13922/g.20325  ORF Transcript_13922/g.20325 Transcript_13922/m.20325 type:complete len:532 (+) Transcript_13922:31-1626(+)
MDLEPKSFIELSRLHDEDKTLVADKVTKFYGWVRRVRVGGGGTIAFLDVYDGTKVGVLNCLAEEGTYLGTDGAAAEGEESKTQDELNYKTLTFEELLKTEMLSIGCAVVVQGKIVLSPPNATQDFEIQAQVVQLIGGVMDPLTYPIQKSTEKKMVSLRNLPFYRFRCQASQSVFRIRSKLNLAVHQFMDQEDVQLTDPNIMTISDCEGAGETFTVMPAMFGNKDAEGNDVPVALTVSSQLPLEAAICGFRQVYTCQKSFRAEKSDTNKHLAEFLHVEYEGAFMGLDALIGQAERFVKHVIKFAYERCEDDFKFLESRMAPTDLKSTRTLLTEALDRPFIRIKHHDAIDLIRKLVKDKAKLPGDDGKMKKVKVKEFPGYEDDLSSEHEKLLVTYFGYMAVPEDQREQHIKDGKEVGAFVFVTHWPLKIKSFYMAQTDDGSGECLSFDLLCPRVGELFGGSMREWRFDKLDAEVKRRGMDISPIQWFLDLRKSGSCPHGGWGMGFDRLCMLVCGAQSVRDVVPFPVYYMHCPY